MQVFTICMTVDWINKKFAGVELENVDYKAAESEYMYKFLSI